ncbi:MAG: hypothetical protein MZV64_72600 [Ignavibacteriales bacterium]|nr:hypothetical protein [Ignavibacteriales bacterium]
MKPTADGSRRRTAGSGPAASAERHAIGLPHDLAGGRLHADLALDHERAVARQRDDGHRLGRLPPQTRQGPRRVHIAQRPGGVLVDRQRDAASARGLGDVNPLPPPNIEHRRQPGEALRGMDAQVRVER